MSSILLPTIEWAKVWAAVGHEFLIAGLAALIVVVIHFLWNRFTEVVAWIRPVKVYGNWNTFLYKQTTAAPSNEVVYENAWERTSNGQTYRLRQQLLNASSGAGATNNMHGPEGVDRHEDAKLKQLLHLVWGEAKLKRNPTIRYAVLGFIRGEKLSLVYREKSGSDSGAILLDISAKDFMKGFEVGVDADEGSIYTRRYEWRKQ